MNEGMIMGATEAQWVGSTIIGGVRSFLMVWGGGVGVGERDVDDGLLGQLSLEFMVSEDVVGDLG